LLNTLHGRCWTLLSRKTYALHRIVADFQTIADDLVRFHPQSRELVEAMTPEMERRFEAEAERIIEWVSSVPFPGLPKHCVQNFYNS
jgi:hypothetical protein